MLSRAILASTRRNAWILDPFTGSSTTGIAANLAGRRFLGIDEEADFLSLSERRKHEIENLEKASEYRKKIADIAFSESIASPMLGETEPEGYDLPF